MHKCVRSFLSVAPRWSITEPSQTVVRTLRARSDRAFHILYSNVFVASVVSTFLKLSIIIRCCTAVCGLTFRPASVERAADWCYLQSSLTGAQPALILAQHLADGAWCQCVTVGCWSHRALLCHPRAENLTCAAGQTGATTGTLTSHPDINRTACHLLVHFRWRNPSYYLFIAEMRF